MLKSDETLDFHNRQIAAVALGERCKNGKHSQAYILTSPLGHIYTNACPDGLHCVKLYGDTNYDYDKIDWKIKVDFDRSSSFSARNKHVVELKKYLQTYFKNPLNCKGMPISMCGLDEYGEFNSKVWLTIMNNCPPGEFMSYVELAQQSGYGAGASKVVGYAINKNPYMIVVGDHRIVKATGEIWCENESQRNKLRRALTFFEISFTDGTLDDALAKVRDRNEKSKGSRKRAGATRQPRVKKEEANQDEDQELPENEDEEEDLEPRGSQKKTKARRVGIKKPTTVRRRRVKKEESSEEDDD